MERLARINQYVVLPLTVYATDGDMVAFKYDSGGYGWAERKTFHPIEEAERIVAEIQERKAREAADANLRARLRIGREIQRAETELARLREMLANYEEDGDA